MKFSDLFSLALNGLTQNKVRFLLTTLGVVIGTFGLVLIISIGEGLEQLMLKQFKEGNQLKQVMVIPGFGSSMPDKAIKELQVQGHMSEEKRLRLKRAMSFRRYRGPSQQFYTVPLTKELVEETEALPLVDLVETVCQDSYRLKIGTQESDRVLGMGLSEQNLTFKDRVLFGRYFDTNDSQEVLLHEYLLYRLGYVSDEEVKSFIGKEIEISYIISSDILAQTLSMFRGGKGFGQAKILEQLSDEQKEKIKDLVQELFPIIAKNFASVGAENEILFTEKLKVIGILKEASRQKGSIIDHGMSLHADLFFPMKLSQRLYLKVPSNRQRGFSAIRVQAKAEKDVKAIELYFKNKGLMAYSMETVLQRLQLAFAGITVFVGALAGIALLVSALGIANTMVMSVLERTKEIGIMKAIGAQDWHIRGIFFIESVYIGICGGVFGIMIAVLSSYPLENFGKQIIREKAHEEFDIALFYFPPWLLFGAFTFALTLSVVAAWIPSRRAARIDPIETLRHD